jgi:tetratricopeptide (TPR) repeat protein
MTRIAVISLAMVFCLSIGYADAQNIPDEARRHFDYGMAAVEMANSPDDYESAIKEFEQAVRLAPGWADAYYNLGMVQKKTNKHNEAITSLKHYLRLAPNANDAETVKSTINKIEYKRQKATEELKITSWLSGKWLGNPGPNYYPGWPVQFIIEGDLVYFYAQIGMDADKGTLNAPVFYNYRKVLVTREGRDIHFRVRLETLARSLGKKWTRDAQYNLKLIGPGKLSGTVNMDGKIRKASFWRE